MDDSSDDGAAVLAHATPGRRHSWASVHTPIDWSSAASLRAEFARVDARERLDELRHVRLNVGVCRLSDCAL